MKILKYGNLPFSYFVKQTIYREVYDIIRW